MSNLAHDPIPRARDYHIRRLDVTSFGALSRGCMSHTVQGMMRHRNSGATLGPAHAVNDGTGNQGSGVLLNRFVPNGLVARCSSVDRAKV